MRAERVCVFLSSSAGARPDYAAAARGVAQALAASGRTLVYGGASVGTMGVLADAAIAAGGRVVGVIPERLLAREIGHADLAELHVVPTMHARKARMFAEADAFITLPGGFGTLEETFEVLTAAQIGEHAKPVCLLDVVEFWRPLLAFLDHAVTEGVLHPANRALIGVARSPAEALAWIDAEVARLATPA
ncbi:MAG: TIGR00730 family Rossman fold protein [Myxococcales bacterium]|nr:TIGR00730 family Rossman fold protein [Myxococcales bacterium]